MTTTNGREAVPQTVAPAAAPRMALVGAAFSLFALGAFAAALVLEAPHAPAPVPEPPRLEQPPQVPAEPARPLRPAQAPREATLAQAAPRAAAVPACAACGVVESVRAVTRKGEAHGVGAVAGAAIGGIVGHQIGGGDGKKAMTVIGAVGGGLAGHEIEKRQRATTVHEIAVRMEDGTLRRVTQAKSLAVGQRVRVDGDRLTPLQAEPAARRDG
jgi:outer membrane lipoprotein SlyB